MAKTETKHTSRTTRIKQPGGAVSPATLHTDQDGASASTGHVQRMSQSIAALWWLPWMGVSLVILAAASFWLRAYIPWWSISGSVSLAALGGTLIFLPTIIEKAWWLPIAVAGVVVLLLFLTGNLDNLFKQRKAEAEVKKLKEHPVS